MGLRDRIKGLLGRGTSATPPAPPSRPVPPSPPAPPAPAPAPAPAAPGVEDKPWYLQADTDGWDATNPGEEPDKKNLRDR